MSGWTDGQTLWASGMQALWRFANMLAPGAVTATGVDRILAPREARITGHIDMHDIGMAKPDIGPRCAFGFRNFENYLRRVRALCA